MTFLRLFQIQKSPHSHCLALIHQSREHAALRLHRQLSKTPHLAARHFPFLIRRRLPTRPENRRQLLFDLPRIFSKPQDLTPLIPHPNLRSQVSGEPRFIHSVDCPPGLLSKIFQKRIRQILLRLPIPPLFQKPIHPLRHRLAFPTPVFRQTTNQQLDPLIQHSRHPPTRQIIRKAQQLINPHFKGQPIILRFQITDIIHRPLTPAVLHLVRKQLQLLLDPLLPNEIPKAHHESPHFLRVFGEIVKGLRGINLHRHPLEKEIKRRHLIPQIPDPPQLSLPPKNHALQPVQILQHRIRSPKLSFHQSLAHKDLESRLGIHPTKENPPPFHHRQTAQDDIFQSIHRTLLIIPIRRVKFTATQMRHHFLEPLRIDLR